MRRLLIPVMVLLVALAAPALVGCGSAPGEGGKLEGVRWMLDSYDSNGVTKNAPGAASADALFERGTVSGFSGVNSFSGKYELSGSKLTVGQLASTMMAGPPELMDFEQSYTAALERADSFTADEDSLDIFDRSGRAVLTYTKGDAASLGGGTWEAINYYNGADAVVGVINGTTVTASFNDDGTVTGFAGVNDYRAEYSTSGKSVTIGAPEFTTEASSPDPAVERQEADFLAALQLAVEFAVRGDRLDLMREGGTIAATFVVQR